MYAIVIKIHTVPFSLEIIISKMMCYWL